MSDTDNEVDDNAVSPLDMTDEQLENFDFSTLDSEPDSEDPETDDDPEQEDPADEETPDPEEEPEQETEEDQDDPEEEKDPESGDVDDNDDDPENLDDDPNKEDKKPDTADKDEIDYKAQYEKLLAPFRANNKDMQVNNVDEAIQLMQMGANYSKKMAAFKPIMKMAQMLENNGLLSEDKLSYLIDLDKKDPSAIAKLVKDAKIDPDDIDVNGDTEYEPKDTYNVSDKEVELESTLAEIRDTDSYGKTLDVITNKWDESSKQTLLDNPAAIPVINNHISLGLYDKISDVVERQRMLGNLKGVSDLDAYMTIGDKLEKEGAFNDQEATPEKTDAVKPNASKPKDDAVTRKRKKAASPAKRASSKKKDMSDFNPLSMSDEDFDKIASSQFT